MARAENTEFIDLFEEFYRDYYRNEIGELAQKYPTEQKSLFVDYQDLYRFDPDLAEDYRNQPEQLQEYAEEALRLFDLPIDVKLGQAHVRMTNLPESTDIRDIRADHRGQLVSIQGIIRKATEVRPKITDAAFECQRCGTLTRIPQSTGDFQEPHECQGCERQGPFRINFDQSEFIDAQKLRVQESPEGLRGGETPQNIDVNIEDDITGHVTAGDHVRVTGVLKLDQRGNDREKSPMFDVYMDGVSVEIEDEEFEEMDIDEADKKEIVALSEERDIYEQMTASIAPSIYGYDQEKLAIALQLFSGVTKHLPDESRIRGDLHVLLIGDPGTGKSQILQYIRHIAPRSVFTSGKGSSSAGLTAAAVRDDFGDGQQWTLEAGALVLADRGIAAVDELDKMRCVTGDTLVSLGNGRISRIQRLARESATNGEIELHANGRTIRDVDLEAWTMTDDGRLAKRPVTAIHEYEAPEDLATVTLESGEELTATRDHPFFAFEDGERVEKAADDLSPGDWVYVPRTIPTSVTDGGVVTAPASNDSDETTLSPAMAAVIGYLSGDGNVYYDREAGVYGIRFTNKEEQLLADFERHCRQAFDAEPTRPPSEQRDDGVQTVRLPGREYADAVVAAGMNLETYDDKAFPHGVTEASADAKAAFVRALADSEGNVDTATGNVRISSSSYELLLGTKQLLQEFSVSSQIQTREHEEKRDLYVLAITAADSLETFARHVGFTLDRKQTALEEVCDGVSGDRTIIDVIPECGDLLSDIRESLRLYQSECGIDDATYCNFENGDANVSIRLSNQILAAFEERAERASTDSETLASDPSWERLSVIKERYHVSQAELADGTRYTQQRISREWGESDELRTIVTDRLIEIVRAVVDVSIEPFRTLVRGDVRWRRVDAVESVTSGPSSDTVNLRRGELADLLDCRPENAIERARDLLATELSTENWSELQENLDRYGVSYSELARDLGVDQSTVSRWFNGVVETERFDEVCTVVRTRIEAIRDEAELLLAEIEAVQKPKVYDLTVEDTHNFLANGMVVHNSEDRSAMHEALEQQSYHPDSEILLADGRRVEIGQFVDERMAERSDDVIDGVDCEILPVENVRIHSADLDDNDVRKLPVDRVSRHEAPEEFVRVSFSNGRSVVVTPDHPMFITGNDGWDTVPASEITGGTTVPAPVAVDGGSVAESPGAATGIGTETITDVERLPNEGEYAAEWVYDVTVEPTNTFVSQGVVLHNSISISKAGINATLKSRCSLLGAANPKYGRFDQYEPIGEQIDLEPALISRFDLIFTVTDQPDEEEDANLAEHIIQTNYAGELNTHRTENSTPDFSAEEVENVTETVAPEIDPELLRKYVAYAKRSCFPTMTEDAKEAIRDFYVELRAKGSGEDAPVPVTARKLEALVRLAEASARVRLSDTVTAEDAERVIGIVRSSLEDIGIDPETGELDADVVETGTSKSQRDRIKNIRGIISDIEEEYDEGAPVDVVIERAEEVGMDETKAEHEIEKLKQQGEVYEPRTDHLRTT